MTLSAANPGGWSLNEVLTSVQMTFLQNEVLKAIDGVNGGTYALSAPLILAGADVQVNTNLVIPSGADIEVGSGGDLNVASGGTATFASGSALAILLGATLTASGLLNVPSGGEARISSGGTLNVNTGGRLDLNTGSEAHVEGTATLDIEGSGGLNVVTGGFLRIQSGGDLRVQTGGDFIVESGGNALFQSGGFATFQAGSGIFIDAANDIGINESNENWRSNLIPFGYIATGWENRVVSGKLVWEQVDVASNWRIVFPLSVPPGDDLVNVFVGLNGENGHGALPSSGDLPVARIVRAALDGTFTTLATRVDQSPDLATYEDPHFLVLELGSLDTGTMPILGTFEPLYIIIEGEKGGSAVAGLEVTSISGSTTARTYRSDQAIYP